MDCPTTRLWAFNCVSSGFCHVSKVEITIEFRSDSNYPRVHDLRTGDFSRDFLEEMSKGQDEPKWMREKRLAAFDLYETLLMPHTSDDDEWRRTVDMRTQDYWRRTKRKMRGFKLDEYKPVTFSASGSSEISDRSGCLPKQVESEEAASGAVGLQDGLPVESFLLKELERKGFTSQILIRH